MSKEKQIEEIAGVICGMKNGCNGCMFNSETCYEHKDAEEIYNAGYRKQSEVAREIFDDINAIKKEYSSGNIDGNELFVRLYLLEKKYTEGET